MSAFDAGTIIGTLELDRDAFTEGLRIARAQADEFAARRPTITPDVDTRVAAAELDALEQRMRDLRNPTIHPDVDTRTAAAELAALQARLDEVTRSRTIDIRTNSTGIPGLGSGSGNQDQSASAISRLTGLVGQLHLGLMTVVSLVPALFPMIAQLAGSSVALIGGLTQGAIALGSFAVVAKSDFTDLSTALKAVNGDATKLAAGPMQVAATALEQLKFAFAALKNETGPSVFGAITSGLHLATGLMQEFEPVINATGQALSRALDIFASFLHGPDMKGFLALTTKEIGPALTGIATILSNFGNGAIRLFTALNPMLVSIGRAVLNVSQDFGGWAKGLEEGGIQNFFNYIKEFAPAVKGLLSDVFKVLTTAIKDLAPLTGPALGFLNQLVKSILLLSPGLQTLVGFMTDLLYAVKPLLPILATLIDQVLAAMAPVLEAILPYLSQFLQFIGHALVEIMPTVISLMKMFTNDVLKPLYPVFVQVLNAMKPLVPTILAGIKQIMPSINTLLLDLGKAFIALLKALIPLLPSLVTIIKLGFDVLVPILKVLTPILGALIALFRDLVPVIVATSSPVLALVAGAKLLTEAWGPVSRFFDRLWGDIEGFFKSASNDIANLMFVLDTIPGAVARAWDALIGWLKSVWDHIWADIKNVWGNIENFFKAIPGIVAAVFSGAASWLINAGMRIITGLWNGIKQVWSDVAGWFSDLSGFIWDLLSDAINWLEGIGEDIINGLWNGMKSIWNDVTGWISNAASSISGFFSSILGIFSPSRVMHQIGVYTMQGLHNGLKETYEGTVAPYMQRIATELSNSFNPKLGANAQITMAASVAIAGQAAAQGAMAEQIASLTQAVRAIPAATGSAVGDAVGDKFTRATKMQTRDLVSAGRRS